MEKITRKIEIKETKVVVTGTKEEEVYVTSDGHEFIQGPYNHGNTRLDAKKDAESHQKDLDTMAAFKNTIGYKDVDLKTCLLDGYFCGNEWDKSFIFNCDDSMDIGLLKRLVDLDMPTPLVKGKYLVIQYSAYHDNPNGRDWYSYSGYFGLLDTYVNEMRDEVNKISDLYINQW